MKVYLFTSWVVAAAIAMCFWAAAADTYTPPAPALRPDPWAEPFQPGDYSARFRVHVVTDQERFEAQRKQEELMERNFEYHEEHEVRTMPMVYMGGK
jgi:hypothetical protein